ncbi:hypothetical protein ACH0BF_16870 [Pseudobacillus sp. 179-B 2D1 NHS]|uniref:HNH endonuclease n=1 Tax=Pseudobacillus sp. 179-B 2D1 NHS TaxID=3374292 RepID=UPI00387982DD
MVNLQLDMKLPPAVNLHISIKMDSKKQLLPSKDSEVDVISKTRNIIYNRTGLIKRLLAGQCEWCHATNVELEIHHVKKLKDLEGKKLWEKRMIERNRKTMALCKKCHVDLHNGKLD